MKTEEKNRKTVWEMTKGFLKYAKGTPKEAWNYFFTRDELELDEITDEDYEAIFIKGRDKEEVLKSYEQAWQAKNFENDNYWKRANYFWLFQAASFTGYFAVLGTSAYTIKQESAYLVACVGFITALAWHLTNKGSKTWQRHWEIHVDMLENKITGPLYKVLTENKTYSVSKINEIVSNFFRIIWFLIIFEYLRSHKFHFEINPKLFDYPITLISFFTFYSAGAMYLGYGRGRFGSRKVTFYKRRPFDKSSSASAPLG